MTKDRKELGKWLWGRALAWHVRGPEFNLGTIQYKPKGQVVPVWGTNNGPAT